MKNIATILICAVVSLTYFSSLLAQDVGDYRTRASGDWSMAQNWERFNGSVWGPIGTPPTGEETITVRTADSINVNVETSISGRLINRGIVAGGDNLTVGNGGVYQHDRDEGSIPPGTTWAEGSTLLMTGTVAVAPSNRNQSYHDVVFNTPEMVANLNMDLDEATIGGDIHVLSTGFGRWYLTSASSNDTSVVTIMGDVFVEDGNFAVHGTGNVGTVFIVHHYGNIEVTGGNFSISRGSQPLGSTRWFIYEGDFSMSNATTQNSTATPGREGSRFIFAGAEPQELMLGAGNTLTQLPIEVPSGSTVLMGSSKLAGGGIFYLEEGGAIGTHLAGGVEEIFEEVVGPVTLEDNSSYIFNGTVAQVTSEEMPEVVADLTIDNAAGVTNSREITINGTLRLVSGVFDNTIPFTLGPDGEISEEGGSLAHSVSSEFEGEIPQTFFVDQNFPNPFNPATTIQFGLPSDSQVTVSVYNVLGQEVRTLFDGFKHAGVHQVSFQAGDLSTGVYLYRVQAQDIVITRQMTLIK